MYSKIKKVFYNVMYFFFAKNVEDIYDKIKKYDYVSFDIFDTLIKRTCGTPENVFYIMERQAGIDNFRIKRIAAQNKAKKNTKNNEITIKEIYDNFGNLTEEQKNFLINLEIKTENLVCKRNKEIYELYRYCLNKGKKIYIISDMYLNLTDIEKLLYKLGYTKYEKILLSSDVMETKKSGKIFEYLINDNPGLRKNIIHIGDHPLSDFINPKKYKIKSILIKK